MNKTHSHWVCIKRLEYTNKKRPSRQPILGTERAGQEHQQNSFSTTKQKTKNHKSSKTEPEPDMDWKAKINKQTNKRWNGNGNT